MAGDYLPMRLDLRDDPAVIQMAADLEMDEQDVVGRLHTTWSWFNAHTADGHATVTQNWLDRHTSTPGWAAAMSSAGWLTVDDDGFLSVPKYDSWNSEAAKKRLQAAERKRKQRAKEAETSDKSGVSQECHASVVTKTGLQNRTGQDTTGQDTTPYGKTDHKCSWKGRAVEISQLKDWCKETFGNLHAGRSKRSLGSDPRTLELLMRIGVLRLCDAVSDAFVQDGCEGLRTVERWPVNPGGWLRATWSDSQYAPANLKRMLGEVELPKGI